MIHNGMIRNVHERHVAADPAAVGELLDTLATPQDAIWPREEWWPMVLDGPLAVGARGGHADIRYTVEAYEPGRRVVFRIDRACGLDGTHALDVEPVPTGTLLRHDVTARPLGRMRLLYPLAVRAIHDAVVEDLFDVVQRRLTPGTPATPWSPYVRLLRRLAGLAPRTAAVVRPVVAPRDGPLEGAPVDYADAFAVDLPAGASSDPEVWRRALFASPPAVLRGLMRLRDVLVTPFGLRRSDALDPAEGFPVLAASDDEVLMGADDKHLDFRVSLRVVTADAGRATLVLTTTVKFHNMLGRLYFLPVKPFHRRIVPAMLRAAVTGEPGRQAVTAVARR